MEKYSYYHLLTGADLPIKSQGYIHSFFENAAGAEFISFDSLALTEVSTEIVERVSLFHPIVGRGGRNQSASQNAKWVVDRCLSSVQRMLRVNRLPKGLLVKKGSEFFSITDELVRDILFHEREIMQFCSMAFCADEVFLQTFVWNSRWREKVYCLDEKTFDIRPMERSMRLIDWKRGNPYTWCIDDFKEIANSKMLFARKFNIETDWDIVYAIAGKLAR